jgi:hypothetical protein
MRMDVDVDHTAVFLDNVPSLHARDGQKRVEHLKRHA